MCNASLKSSNFRYKDYANNIKIKILFRKKTDEVEFNVFLTVMIMFMCLVEPLYLTVSCPFNRVVTLGECVWALISALQEVLFGISLSWISSCVRKPALVLYSHSFLTVKIQPDLPVDSRLTLIEFLKIEIHNSPAIHSPFKVKNSMSFNAFTGLYNHHH